MKKLIPVLFLIISFATAFAQLPTAPATPTFKRQYKTGDMYRYKLTLSEYRDDKLQFTNVSVCELRVVDSNRMQYDEVRWLSKKVIRGKDTIDQGLIAVSTRPYLISLAGFGKLDLPKIERAEMTEPLEDFNTFFAAISPGFFMMGRRFSQPGDSVYMKTPIKANFANGSTIPKGEDCLAISLRILSATEQETHLFTSFMPPAQPCLSYILSDMNTPVVSGSPNNFQMVSPAGSNLFSIQYGREFFYINTTLSNVDGKILHAEMYNQLNLIVKDKCDGNYQNCRPDMPVGEVRKLSLELLR
ncbi:MAG TPA: hypothetical protein VFE53_16625 [Mucilaginibacter sp.]|jgi:hypothetical protein|nr:hypothetical protein [Mucilaginibacter sp.]